MKWKKVGRGMLVGALRMPSKASLSRRLLDNIQFQAGKQLEGAEVAAQSILSSELIDNSLLISNFGVTERGVPGLVKGTPPIFWWPIKTKNIHDIIFSGVLAISLYNPTHLWQLLRKKGFELEIGDRAHLNAARKKIGSRTVDLQNFEYFQMLITHYLMSEDDVISMIESALEYPSLEKGSIRIEISPQIRV